VSLKNLGINSDKRQDELITLHNLMRIDIKRRCKRPMTIIFSPSNKLQGGSRNV